MTASFGTSPASSIIFDGLSSCQDDISSFCVLSHNTTYPYSLIPSEQEIFTFVVAPQGYRTDVSLTIEDGGDEPFPTNMRLDLVDIEQNISLGETTVHTEFLRTSYSNHGEGSRLLRLEISSLTLEPRYFELSVIHTALDP